MTKKTDEKHSGAARIARRDGRGDVKPAPLFVLVEPQMGENIGAAARAMLNFGISGLRLVNPRDGWPNEKAGAMAAGATLVVDRARVFETTREALADCNYVLATTARSREALLPVLAPAAAGAELKSRIDRGERCAVLFGGERSGLANDDVMRADAIVSIPVNPAFASLNLAQAALIIAYEWAKAEGRTAPPSELEATLPASRENFERFVAHLVGELEKTGYFFPEEKRPNMERNLKVAFMRAGLTEGEVRSLRGVIKALVKGRKD
ncbi:RNA methyltransferase [Hyphococcus luteus]|uniref:tRNA (cytidine/uridine-2'-O-)-methyltransferase TrmJ n=1 Tax=Hyphococcus luteus TaxID=2058213 RepID=A0A2S7K9J0_9PROT|nr:RNA methyltransferase [Marinicaulis flavus]PQA89119.1 rRNA methyltransferase [Marinicaulis flavus]